LPGIGESMSARQPYVSVGASGYGIIRAILSGNESRE
jgi:hypothetical protein